MPLTTESMQGMVAGIPNKEGGRMQIEVKRAMFVRGQLVEPGDVIEVDDLVAGRLVGMGKAIGVAGRQTATATPVVERAVDPVTSEFPKSAAPKSAAKKSPAKKSTK